MLPVTPEFLQTLRAVTKKHGIVLIFDEVITLRLSTGGAQLDYGITPDLTCMGKIIDGGLPVGGVGGKASLMQLFSPEQKNPVMHASAFSGNALTMAAGLDAMQKLNAAEISRLNKLGGRLRDGFNQAFDQAGLRAQALGTGSLSNIHFDDAPTNDARDFIAGAIAAGSLVNLLHLTMIRHGVLSATRLMYCTSTSMTETEIDAAVTAMHESLAELRPHIEQDWPALLR